ncbi:MAG: hypothetical protein L0G94_19620 [Brachybacterium sp.]|uniref:hypothetical protein n=1 Tax=Brachybacterium sp. TaxID=1891286 RepID=UPI00264822D1|nr:hypothetical protein [Brachybacterium sp.]MDN5688866.1 hypothetical protein [Brachybacterium sp.]
MNSSLPWPTEAPAIPLLSVRPVLDRIASLARTHEQDVTLVPGFATHEEELAADPPPALEQILDELGGIELCGHPVLNLLIEDRTDVGPYTLLGPATTFYPLYETPDAAVILTIDDDGAPGAIYGIGEDLALQLAAADLPSYLERFADALEASLAALGEAPEEGEARTELAEQLMDEHLFAAFLGEADDDEDDAGVSPDAADSGAVTSAEATTVPVQSPSAAGPGDLPEGTIAVADLRQAPLGARVELIDADVPGDPLDLHVAWRERGRVVALLTA